MTTLRIDTQAKTPSLVAELARETSPIEADIHYSIEKTEQGTAFVPLEIRCSREWLSVLAAEFLKTGQARLAIPKGLPSAAVKILGL